MTMTSRTNISFTASNMMIKIRSSVTVFVPVPPLKGHQGKMTVAVVVVSATEDLVAAGALLENPLRVPPLSLKSEFL